VSPTAQAVAGRERRAATRRQVLEATRRLLGEGRPVAGLSVDRIVAAAGISRATFYVHFAGKGDVVAALCEQDMEPWLRILRPVLADAASDRTAIVAVVRAYVANWRAHAAVGASLVELAEHDPAVRDVWHRAVDDVAAPMAEHLRRRWAGRPGPHPDPDATAHVVAWAVERATHKMLAADPAGDAAFAETLAEVVWRVLEPGG